MAYASQRKAWFDRRVTVWWIKTVLEPYLEGCPDGTHFILILDNCNAHKDLDASAYDSAHIHIIFRLREQEEEEERLADEKTCPSMAEALAACATMAKYARHRMDDRDLQRALACAQSIRRHNIKAKAQMKQIPLVELWRRGK